MKETAKQFRRSSGSTLDGDQLRLLGDAALASNQPELAYAVSAAGLARGGVTAARFLLLRAHSLPLFARTRRSVCLAAAAALARQHRDTALVQQAVDDAAGSDLVLTPEQAAHVLEQETAHGGFPTTRRPGPVYADMVAPGICQCPACQRERMGGGLPDDVFEDGPDDEDLDWLDEDDGNPSDVDLPPAMYAALFDEMRSAMRRGETPQQFVARILGGEGRRSTRRKRRRKQT